MPRLELTVARMSTPVGYSGFSDPLPLRLGDRAPRGCFEMVVERASVSLRLPSIATSSGETEPFSTTAFEDLRTGAGHAPITVLPTPRRTPIHDPRPSRP